MAFGALPFGLTDVKVYPLDGTDAPIAASVVSMPAGRTVDVTPREDTKELTGYNGVVASNVTNTSADIGVEYGGIALDLLALITGGTIATTGVSPTQTKTLEVGKAGIARPYVCLIGKALGDSGGDTWIRVHKAKFELPKGNFREGEYYVSSLSGKAVRNAGGNLLAFIQHEADTAIAP